MTVHNLELKNKHIVYMIDRDYTLDINAFLLRIPHHLLLYTATPQYAAGTSLDGTFWFQDNEYHERVPGGGNYSHPLWNYAVDHVSVYQSRGYLDGIYRTFRVERRRATNTIHRSVVLFELATQYEGLAGYVAMRLYGTSPVKRVCPLIHGFNVVDHFSESTLYRSLAYDGGASCTTVRASFVDVVRTAYISGGKTFNSHSVAELVKSHEHPTLTSDRAQMLIQYVKATPTCIPVETANTVPPLLVYQVVGPKQPYEQYTKPCVVEFMKPIGPPAYAARFNLGTVADGVVKRLCDVANPPLAPIEKLEGQEAKKPDGSQGGSNHAPNHLKGADNIEAPKNLQQLVTLHPSLANSIMHFANSVIPSPGSLSPLTPEEAYATLKRPTQRAKYAAALHDDPTETTKPVNCFPKAEAAGKFADIRNISPLPAATQSNMTRYTVPLSNYIKKHNEWYAFGRTPRELAEHIARKLSAADSVFLGDFSRMDGRVSNLGRLVTNAIYRRAYGTSGDLERVLEGKTGRKLRLLFRATNQRVEVDTSGNSRLSGEAGTSLDNTVENAFIAFHAYFCILKDRDLAWKALGNCCFGGDDSLMPNMKKRNYTITASILGHVVTGEELKRGASGVNFLSRFFGPTVWHGDSNSCSDIRRQLSKFHTTTRMPKSKEDKLIEKCQSFILTDANTPVLGQVCRKVLEIAKPVAPLLREGVKPARWWDQYEGRDQFPNNNTDNFMDALLTNQLPTFNVKGFTEWIESRTTLAEIMEGYGCEYDIAPKAPNVVCDQILDDTVVTSDCAAIGDGADLGSKLRLSLKNFHTGETKDVKEGVKVSASPVHVPDVKYSAVAEPKLAPEVPGDVEVKVGPAKAEQDESKDIPGRRARRRGRNRKRKGKRASVSVTSVAP
jgi:hypothetical protein